MSQVVKFPDMRPPARPKIAPLPSLAEYRQIKPTLATKDTSTEMTPERRRFRRHRLLKWFGVAVALHTALLLAFFLSPPMRLKWNPPPEDWVPVVSLPKPEPAPISIPESTSTAEPMPAKPAPQLQSDAPSKARKHSSTRQKTPPQAEPARSS